MEKVKASDLLNARTYQMLVEMLDKANKTKQDEKRLEECKRLIGNELARVRNGQPKNCGLNGCLFEILSSSEKSTKCKVAKQGKKDNAFYLDGKRTKCEDKTNGGRLGQLYTKKGTPRKGYIVVGYCVLSRSWKTDKATGQRVKNYKWYVAPDTIWKISDFLEMLEKYELTKYIGHADKNDRELAIKGDNKKLYNILCDYPLTYYSEVKYTSEDFEGLEI